MMKKELIMPPFLQSGDKVAIVSPSGKMDVKYIEGMAARLKSCGLQVLIGSFADAEYGRFAGTDDVRLYDLQSALDAPNVKAIFCSRGGYGCVHLVHRLNWTHFKKSPKWLIGYSDITILHAAIQHQGCASIHAPMAKHFTEEDEADEAVHLLKSFLFGEKLSYAVPNHPLNKQGRATGKLTGGNLSVLCGLRGTSFDLIPENAILFIEDIGERPYQVERMLYNLKLGGILEKLSGLIIGQFTDYEEDPLMMLPLYENMASLVAEYDYPVCFDFPVGHVTKNYPLICGGNYSFEVREEGVKLELL